MALTWKEQMGCFGVFVGGGVLTFAIMNVFVESSPVLVNSGTMPSQSVPILDDNECVTNCPTGKLRGKEGNYCVFQGVSGVREVPGVGGGTGLPEGVTGASPGECPLPGGRSIDANDLFGSPSTRRRPFESNARQMLPTATSDTQKNGTIFDSNAQPNTNPVHVDDGYFCFEIKMEDGTTLEVQAQNADNVRLSVPDATVKPCQ